MFKTFIKCATALFCSLIGFFLLGSIYAPTLWAKTVPQPGGQTVVLVQPGVSGQFQGHPGTLVSINGTGYMAGATINLYATSDNAEQCGPGTTGLQSIATLIAKNDGTFQTPDGTKWPDGANVANTPYYVCAVSGTQNAIASATFKVAAPVTVAPSATSINPGGQITISGDNWFPPQRLTITITPTGQANAAVSGHTTSDGNGHFSKDLTLPATATSGNYSINVIADNEQTPAMTLQQDNAFAVNALPTPTPAVTPTPTPTPTVTPTPTPKPIVTPTPTSNTSNINNSGSTGMSVLIFALGGIGVVLVVVGIIMFAAYSRPSV